jgi:cytochrome c oxidase cbb3-type subunit 3
MKMTLMFFVLSTAISATAFGADAKKIANGKFLFEDWGCKGCHSIGTKYNQDPTKGPDLKGVFSRRSPEWIKKFTHDPQAMIDSGDKDANEMFKKFNSVMKKLKLSEAEWNDVYVFLKSEK